MLSYVGNATCLLFLLFQRLLLTGLTVAQRSPPADFAPQALDFLRMRRAQECTITMLELRAWTFSDPPTQCTRKPPIMVLNLAGTLGSLDEALVVSETLFQGPSAPVTGSRPGIMTLRWGALVGHDTYKPYQ
jgi:hypothetical protein